jgi:hypothetical protein
MSKYQISLNIQKHNAQIYPKVSSYVRQGIKEGLFSQGVGLGTIFNSFLLIVDYNDGSSKFFGLKNSKTINFKQLLDRVVTSYSTAGKSQLKIDSLTLKVYPHITPSPKL